jgi:hypothetical protein
MSDNVKKGKQVLAGTAAAQPWRVLLQVRPSLLATELQPVIYYVRGRVDEVGNIAYLMWKRWEKADVGLGGEQYPDIEENGIIECIDEDDFKSAYKEIKKYRLPYAAAGNPKNPTVFTCFKRTNL